MASWWSLHRGILGDGSHRPLPGARKLETHGEGVGVHGTAVRPGRKHAGSVAEFAVERPCLVGLDQVPSLFGPSGRRGVIGDQRWLVPDRFADATRFLEFGLAFPW